MNALEQTGQDGTWWIVLLSAVICVTFTFTLGICLCCRRKVHKNDLLGLEGRMVNMSPDETISGKPLNGSAAGEKTDRFTAIGDQVDHHHHHENEKRVSGATHRSLPDIPTVDDDIEAAAAVRANNGQIEREENADDRGGDGSGRGGEGGQAGDTNSDLYATVGDKVVGQRGAMPGHVLDHHNKQSSISQHSSLSQADDISSPYASVRSPPHAYDKIRKAEHPYAQLQPTASSAIAEGSSNGSRRASSESLLGSDIEDSARGQIEIPAASAIAGRVSASQELPYMTPPIVQQQPLAQNLLSNAPPPQLHFSGDSQDSSKGYTSISVREPLANILAQTKSAAAQQRKTGRRFQDSHYATVSDDSDEMYAAIEDPSNPVELYTSGSETYAQIQPMMVVNVEVNSQTTTTAIPLASLGTSPATTAMISSSTSSSAGIADRVAENMNNQNINISNSLVNSTNSSTLPLSLVTTSTTTSMEPPAPPPPTLPPPPTAQHSRQASSSSSIGGILGSPKPEKRQANSPLPPTPKSNAGGKVSTAPHYLSNTTLNSGRNSVASSYGVEFSPGRGKEGAEGKEGDVGVAGNKKKSPSKDLEGMYAKVMKKNKLSNVPSENSSPLFNRRLTGDVIDIGELSSTGSSSSGGGGGSRESSAEKQSPLEQNNYETIERKTVTKRSSSNKDPGYETIPGEKCRRDLLDSLNAAQQHQQQSESGTKSRNSAPAGVLAEGIHRVSQNSLNILKGGVVVVDGLLTEEPLSLISNDDPGYETVRQVGGILKLNRAERPMSQNESSSEHDPNYETLLPNSIVVVPSTNNPRRLVSAGDDEEEDGYSKIKPGSASVLNTTTTSDSDGYSSITNIPNERIITTAIAVDEEEDEEPGYSQIGGTAKKNAHGYSSIEEAKRDRLEGYSTIGENGSVAAAVIATTTNSNSSVSPISPINYFPVTTTSVETTQSSYSSNTSPSSEFSSTEVMNRNSTGLMLMMMSSSGEGNNNYESLTSEDPNYETVRHHLRITENPYEVLENELGTPMVDSGREEKPREETDHVEKGDNRKVSPSDSPEVGDYFQV